MTDNPDNDFVSDEFNRGLRSGHDTAQIAIAALRAQLATANARAGELKAAINDVSTHRNAWVGLISQLHRRMLLDPESGEADLSYVIHELRAMIRDLGALVAVALKEGM